MDEKYTELEHQRDETFATLATKVEELMRTDPAVNRGNNEGEALRLIGKLRPNSERDTRARQVKVLDADIWEWLRAPSPTLSQSRLTELHAAVDQYQQLMNDLGPEETNKDFV